MKLVLHGELKDRYGESLDFASDTVADAIEGFSRQVPDFPRDMIIDAVGFDTEEKLREVTDAKEVHLIPAMFGGGGSFGKILLGIALIAIAIVTFNAGLIGASFALAMFSAGISLTLGGIMQLFMKAPTVSKSNDPDASKYLGNNKNTAAFGTPIIMAWGKVKLYPHWLSIQVNSNNMVYGTYPVTPT